MSKRRAGFRSVTNRNELYETFGKGKLPGSGVFQLTSTVELDLEASRAFLEALSPELALADYIVRIRNEKSRYLIVYEVLKQFIRFGRGHILLEASTVEEAMYGSPSVEFLVFAGPERTEKIRFVVKVKEALSPPQFETEATWQFLAELLTASERNGNGEIWGALTDAYRWYFFRATRMDSAWEVTAANPVTLFESPLQASATTSRALGLFFKALYPDITRLCREQLNTAHQAIDKHVSDRASVFVQEAVMQAATAAIVAEKDAEIQRLKAQLASISSPQ